MALYFIGLGLWDEKDISLKGLEIIKKCYKVFLESYTSILGCQVSKLEGLYKKKIILADRELVEQSPDTILDSAKNKDVAFLVIGDPFSATTHIGLMLTAKERGIEVKVIHNASVLTAIGITGLQLYKFGKTTSIPFPSEAEIETPYNAIKDNKDKGMHTLILLDLNPKEDKYLTIKQAIEILFDIEKKKNKKIFTSNTLCIGCARLGSSKPVIKVGKASALLDQDFGKAPYCLIVPGVLHFMEEKALKLISD